MTSIILAFAAAAVVLWKTLGYLRFYMASSPLRQLPGPKSESFLAGTHILTNGHNCRGLTIECLLQAT